MRALITASFDPAARARLERLMDVVHEDWKERLDSAADFLAVYTGFTGFELGERTVGLVGLGAVGREVARRLLPFKARVLAADPCPADVPPGVTLVELDDLLREADIVSLH